MSVCKSVTLFFCKPFIQQLIHFTDILEEIVLKKIVCFLISFIFTQKISAFTLVMFNMKSLMIEFKMFYIFVYSSKRKQYHALRLENFLGICRILFLLIQNSEQKIHF